MNNSLKLKKKHNLLPNINTKFPIEIISEILISLILDMSDYTPSNWIEMLFILTHVCNRWKHVAINTSLIWKQLKLHIPEEKTSKTTFVINQWFQINENRKISLSIKWLHEKIQYFDDIYTTLHNRNNLDSLQMDFTDICFHISFINNIKFPELTYLDLQDHIHGYCHTSESINSEYQPHFKIQAPKLANLYIFISSPQSIVNPLFKNLTTLHICGPVDHPIMLLSILDQLPFLQEIGIYNKQYQYGEDVETINHGTIKLLHLTRLGINSHEGNQLILHHLYMPILNSIYFYNMGNQFLKYLFLFENVTHGVEFLIEGYHISEHKNTFEKAIQKNHKDITCPAEIKWIELDCDENGSNQCNDCRSASLT